MREYTDAFEQVERWAVPADVAAVAVTYAGALIGSGQTERASAIVGRIARWADRDFACAVLQASLYRALGQRWRFAGNPSARSFSRSTNGLRMNRERGCGPVVTRWRSTSSRILNGTVDAPS